MSRSLRCVRSWLRFMTGMIATAMDIASRASKPPAAMSTWDRIGIRRLLMGLARKQLFPGAHLLQGSPNCGYSNRIVLKDAPRSAGMILSAHRRAVAHGDGDQQGPAAPTPPVPAPRPAGADPAAFLDPLVGSTWRRSCEPTAKRMKISRRLASRRA